MKIKKVIIQRNYDYREFIFDDKINLIYSKENSKGKTTLLRAILFGLGYNILVFVYDKKDTANSCTLDFKYCTFIDKSRTADYTITKRLREMVDDGANKEDIIGFLVDKNVPGDDIVYSDLADEILCNKPEQGYLTISNALQWRLQYARVIALDNTVNGVLNYEW